MEKINILSLFDGMSCGQIALDRLGIPVGTYYASEIDKYAIAVTQHNYPETVQLGDVTKWRERDIDRASIDLLQGGSPCQGFSLAGKQLNFEDPRSKLFFVFVDILNHIKQHNPQVKFLLENVRMKKEYQDIITDHMGVNPIKINSALVSAQNRIRLYWTNIEGVEQPKDRGILLKDVLDDNADPNVAVGIVQTPRGHNKGGLHKEKSPSMTSSHREQNNKLAIIDDTYGTVRDDRAYTEKGPTLRSGRQGFKVVTIRKKSKTVRSSGLRSYDRHEWDSVDDLHTRKLTPKECERLQTVPDDYTLAPHPVYKGKDMSNAQRYKMLGNGWTVDVIAHIYSSI